MTLLNNMTIKARMILSSALMILLFTIFGVISINQIKVLGNLTSTLYNHPLQVSTSALKAKSGIISMHRSMKDVSTSLTPLAVDMAIHNVQVEEKKVYEELFTIRKLILGQEGKDLLEETITLFTGWEPIRIEVAELVLEGDRDAANKITREKGADYVVHLEQKMESLTSYALNKADGFIRDARKVENTLYSQGIIFTVVLVLIAVAIAFFMSSSVLANVSFLKNTMTNITETGELKTADLKGNNEISQMAKHFNRLIDRLRGQFWLSEGLNNLNRELSGEIDHDEILHRSIEYTSRYVNACAGALFLYNEEKALCELKSSYAFVRGNYLSKKFKLGHGIVGQVAKEKKSILLKNISRQDAVGQSGTVNEPPVNVYVLPLFYEEKLYGVLEIASFEKINEIRQNFLTSAGNVISIFLHTSFQNNQIKELLEISRDANETLHIQTEELQAQTQELQALNEEFKQQSDELKEQNLELEAQQMQVEEANRLKSEFLSNMSHELRTPLNSVNALSRVLILQAKDKLSKEEVSFLEIIERNGKHLLSLINDILDLSKIESGRMDISLKHFSIKTLIENVMEGIKPLALQKNLKFEGIFSKDLPEIESDEYRVFQILQNIIANAVKFTDQGSIKVFAVRDKEDVCIRVQDSGIGISKDDIENIFDEFRQLDGASTRKFEGTGLGLAIAHKAVKMLGGGLFVESSFGSGSTFTIILPVIHDGPKKILEVMVDAKADQNILIENGKNQDQVETTGFQLKNQKRKGTKGILLVEDNDAAVIQVKKALETIGINVDVARDGIQALEYIQYRIPKGIILDLMMPNIDGFQVLETIRGTIKTKHIPVLILTAKDLTKNDLKRLSSNNVWQLIQKGDVDREELLNKVKLMLEEKSEAVIKREKHKPEKINSNGIKRNRPLLLVIEDNPDNMTTVKAVIRKDYSVEEAIDGQQGLKKALDLIPDLILLDISLPKIDGLTVVKELKKNQLTRNIPVIAMTAQAMKGDKEKMIGSGCDDYIAKPIDLEKFSIKLKKWASKTGKEIL